MARNAETVSKKINFCVLVMVSASAMVAAMARHQGCQMVYFQTENANLGKL
jgi:hypothetical protein